MPARSNVITQEQYEAVNGAGTFADFLRKLEEKGRIWQTQEVVDGITVYRNGGVISNNLQARKVAGPLADYVFSRRALASGFWRHLLSLHEKLDADDQSTLPLPAPETVKVTQAKRTRRPITDPELMERRRQALVKARAARAERLATTRASKQEASLA